uniref:Protein Vpu n=1 Tax=Human immunodeficiency virus type 1 TaxID=11676 RepID=A0A0A0USI1_HV1|nr:vpu protein [Human immunodeficiency virus 1]
MVRFILQLAVGIFVLPLIMVICVGPIIYIKYKIWETQKKREGLIKNIGERAKHCGYESEGDTEDFSTVGDGGPIAFVDVIGL